HAPNDLKRSPAQASAALDRAILAVVVAATSCAAVPVLLGGTALLDSPTFRGRPHAYAKLWKHHAADGYARRIAAARPDFLRRYDNQTSSEWSLAKAWQTMAEDPQ